MGEQMATDQRPVKLSLGTWLTLMGFMVTLLTAMGVLAAFVFHTEADAQQHIGDYKALKIESTMKDDKNESEIGEFKKEHIIQRKALEAVNQNIMHLMKVQGLGRRAKALPDPEDFESLAGDEGSNP